jgi:hypothetical protein
MLTGPGQDALDRLVAARRARLAALLHDWSPEQHEELDELLRRLARVLVPEIGPTHQRPSSAVMSFER